MTKLLKAAITPPRVMITDKLRSYGAARAKKMGLCVTHRQHEELDNRAENSYQWSWGLTDVGPFAHSN